jgi:hypothetical protein
MYIIQQKKSKITKNRQLLVKFQKKLSVNALIIVFFITFVSSY